MITEGSKNTVLGVALTALLAGVGWMISVTQGNREHLIKLDVVMEQNAEILRDVHQRVGTIPEDVEKKLDELRTRINLHEARINAIENKR